MKELVKLGVIGLGNRGKGLVEHVLVPMCKSENPDVQILAVCDSYDDRAKAVADYIKDQLGITPLCTTDYRDVLEMDELDAVVIASAWESHIQIAIEAMKAGKYVGLEVGGAYSIEELWVLVNTFETTGVHCMLLENCCYGRRELMVLNMVKKGVFGDIVHCSGGYCHDLRSEIAYGEENRHYRLRNYLHRNCDNYPTHELGPIAKILNINNGNRMISLTSTSSISKGLHEYILRQKGPENKLASAVFNQGDVVTTVIRCINGETITITLDTTLPRAYSRGFTVCGTKGRYSEDTDSIFIDGVHNHFEFDWKPQWGNAENYINEYEHPLWKDFLVDIRGGHGGMDWLVFRSFIESVKTNSHPPIDVYDAAALMCISVLSEQSIACGSQPVAIPDFTNGKWINRKFEVENRFSLHTISEDKSARLY
jgi:hypothetical protein